MKATKATTTIPDKNSNSSPSSSNNNNNNNNNSNTNNIRILKQQLKLLLIVRCLRSAHLAQPLLVPYYSQSLQLQPPSILWLGSFYSALVTIAELPSGFISDHIGRRTTLHIAFVGFGASLLLTAFASTQLISSSVSSSASASSSSIWGILGVAQFLRAIGSSMYSGTDMAFLYEIIQKYNGNNSDCDSDYATNGNNNGSSKNNNKKKTTTGTNNAVVVDVNTLLLQIESRNIFYTTSTEAIVAALGGWIAKRVGLPTVVALSSIPFLVGAILSLFLQDCSNKSSSQQRRPTATATLAVITSSPTQPQVEPPIPIPLPRILPRKTSLATFPTIAPSGLSRSNRNLTNINVNENENESNTIIQFFRTAITKMHVYVPTKLWTLFFVGVVLNCATYVASTALNPLLWELVGIPIAQFGTLHAGCGAISAIGALTAPTIRTYISSISTIIIRKRKRRTNNNISLDNDTEGLLLFMLCTSAVAYGLMTLSAIIRLQIFTTLTNASTSSSSNSHSTATKTTTSSIGCAILASFLLSLVRGLAWPVLGSAINTAVTHNNSRATTLSLFSGSIKVGMVVTGMVLATWLAGKGLSESGSVSVPTPSLPLSAPPHLSAATATTPVPISTNNDQEQPQESKKEQ
ncbi:hypothetical protein FRACYDRAFT_254166 [Fragilariopsis cylindrus CCMP1102]|uniref:MFS general substrate transporter n=1 Tax=Fragilariopsis cylindrus CCMP1102 TaxID=635003 RepID=A0A1E7EL54_9STRA|nr:hypothetical protein FRACYDRAFT_254166 [Fragilariopsis cylindrus CCMP1102]|eukprot:OEU06616.1 hypothetical protein FRACYDRAFT_254166 [Fragilariopsis cylindrus CCMP1102]